MAEHNIITAHTLRAIQSDEVSNTLYSIISQALDCALHSRSPLYVYIIKLTWEQGNYQKILEEAGFTLEINDSRDCEYEIKISW